MENLLLTISFFPFLSFFFFYNLFFNDYIFLVVILYYIDITYFVLFNAKKPSGLTLLIIKVRGHLIYLKKKERERLL